MTAPDPKLLETLREQTQELLQEVPGPLRKVSVSAGDSAVTVEWADPDTQGPDTAASDTATPAAPEDDAPAGVHVTAPLVGTFYRCPEPGAAPFVDEGDTVEQGQTVAIVEAMKLMNPVKAPAAGTVTHIHPDDGQMVEFDQPLMTLDPS